jgi:hypothetical protein
MKGYIDGKGESEVVRERWMRGYRYGKGGDIEGERGG